MFFHYLEQYQAKTLLPRGKANNWPKEGIRPGKRTQDPILLPSLDLAKKYKVNLIQHSVPFLYLVFIAIVWIFISLGAPTALLCPTAALYPSLPLKAVAQSPQFSLCSTIKITFQFPWLGSLFKSSTKGICG